MVNDNFVGLYDDSDNPIREAHDELISALGVYSAHIFQLRQDVNNVKHVINRARKETFDLDTISRVLEDRLNNIDKIIEKLYSVIKPDKTDTHNINRRIEQLALRISALESKKR